MYFKHFALNNNLLSFHFGPLTGNPRGNNQVKIIWCQNLQKICGLRKCLAYIHGLYSFFKELTGTRKENLQKGTCHWWGKLHPIHIGVIHLFLSIKFLFTKSYRLIHIQPAGVIML